MNGYRKCKFGRIDGDRRSLTGVEGAYRGHRQ